MQFSFQIVPDGENIITIPESGIKLQIRHNSANIIFVCNYSTLVNISSKDFTVKTVKKHGEVTAGGSLNKSFTMAIHGSEFVGSEKTASIQWSLKNGLRFILFSRTCNLNYIL